MYINTTPCPLHWPPFRGGVEREEEWGARGGGSSWNCLVHTVLYIFWVIKGMPSPYHSNVQIPYLWMYPVGEPFFRFADSVITSHLHDLHLKADDLIFAKTSSKFFFPVICTSVCRWTTRAVRTPYMQLSMLYTAQYADPPVLYYKSLQIWTSEKYDADDI